VNSAIALTKRRRRNTTQILVPGFRLTAGFFRISVSGVYGVDNKSWHFLIFAIGDIQGEIR